jgi:hypothetical protein
MMRQGQTAGTAAVERDVPRRSTQRKLLILLACSLHGPVAELADAADLKSVDPKGSCGFDPHRGH